jgi:FMN phosphatase YigB (HAD superfamily)
VSDVAAFIVDVGGTLWPDRPRSPDGGTQDAVARLRSRFPDLERQQATLLGGLLAQAGHIAVDGNANDIDAAIRVALGEVGLGTLIDDAGAVRCAYCVPADANWPFDAARTVLEAMHERAPVALLSNTVWRDAHCYWNDAATLGWAPFVDHIVTSVDVGFRKPHPAMLDAALALVGDPDPHSCYMVGDNELADIAPAAERGMRTVCVAIETPVPNATRADLVVRSLHELTRALTVEGGADLGI